MEITIAPDGHDKDDVEKESEDFQPACHSTICIYIYNAKEKIPNYQ